MKSLKSPTDVKDYIGKSKAEKAEKKIAKGYQLILEALEDAHGLDWKNDVNYDETPQRIAKSMLYERCKGINSMDYCKELLTKIFPSRCTGFVIPNAIMVNSLCPHHFENVSYVVLMGYLPANNQTVGLSKVGRVIDLYGRQPILQETYTHDLADIFYEALKPEGCGVIVKGQHNCMVARGVQQPDVWVTTSELRGSFLDNAQVRDEFLKLAIQEFDKVKF